MTYKELFYFTGHCLSLDEHPAFRETIVQKIQAEDINWESFVQLCSDHLVIPVIYLKFKAHNLLNILPKELTKVMTEIYELNRERNAKILLQIDHITAALHTEQIIPVFLKGTANLLDGLYRDLGERMMGDIDFLVTEENYLRTASIMKGIGYTHYPSCYVDNRSPMHYPCLYKMGEIAPVEIHRMPVSIRHSRQFNSQMVFKNKKAVIEKKGLFVPYDQHKLIHTFIHSQLADRCHAYKQSSFRELYDLYLLSKRMNVSTMAGQCGYKNKAISWLVFSQRVLGLPGRLYPIETNGAKWFCWKYDCSLSFVKTYKLYVSIKKILHLIGQGYISGVVKAFTDKEERLYLFKRIKNPKWYRAHWVHYKEYIN